MLQHHNAETPQHQSASTSNIYHFWRIVIKILDFSRTESKEDASLLTSVKTQQLCIQCSFLQWKKREHGVEYVSRFLLNRLSESCSSFNRVFLLLDDKCSESPRRLVIKLSDRVSKCRGFWLWSLVKVLSVVFGCKTGCGLCFRVFLCSISFLTHNLQVSLQRKLT